MSETTYTTIQGDMWDAISFKALGSTGYVDRLMMLNTEYIDRYMFPAGVVLTLPTILPDDLGPELPPWRRAVG